MQNREIVILNQHELEQLRNIKRKCRLRETQQAVKWFEISKSTRHLGPSDSSGKGDFNVLSCRDHGWPSPGDSEFIASSFEDVPFLLDLVDRLLD